MYRGLLFGPSQIGRLSNAPSKKGSIGLGTWPVSTYVKARVNVLLLMQVIYNPQELEYEQLLDTFFQHVDPTTKDRQGGDRGTQYRSAIYYHTPEQKAAAQKVRVALLLHVLLRALHQKRHLAAPRSAGKRSTHRESLLLTLEGFCEHWRMQHVCAQSLLHGASCNSAVPEASTHLPPLHLLRKLRHVY